MADFLNRIEHLSKQQLQGLVRAMRDEILLMRPDEVEGDARRAAADMSTAHLYHTCWRAAPMDRAADQDGLARGASRVLLLTDRAARRLGADARRAPVAWVGAALDAETGWAPDTLAAQLAHLIRASGPFDAIVYAPSPSPSRDGLTVDEIGALPRRWSTALALAAAVAGTAAPARLWWLTRGALRLPGDPAPADIALAPLAALGRTLSLEHPAAWGGMIDIDATPGAFEAACREISRGAAGRDDEVAYRSGARYVAVLRRVAEAQPPSSGFVPSREASYLVTGGMGGIGTVLVDDLLARGAGRVVVLGRRAPASPQALAWLAARRRTAGDDARVALFGTDLGDAAALARTLDTARRDGPPLRGLFHLAGSNERIALTRLSAADIARIVEAKALGAAYLAYLTRDDGLDFQVYFSSIAGSWGTARMAPYAMANRFLDALAEQRDGDGSRTLSVGWGPWAEVGMMIRQRQRGYSALGFGALPPADALAQMTRIIGQTAGCATRQIVDVDWRRYGARVANPRHLRPFADLGASAVVDGCAPEAGAPTAAEAGQADDFSTNQAVLNWLRELVAELVGEAVPTNGESRPMQDLGLNSLLSVELSEKIRQRLGVPCRATVAFDFPTLHALSEALAEAWAHTHPRRASAATGTVATPTASGTGDGGGDDGAIAIVGLACRLPGADSPEALWTRLDRPSCDGTDAIEPRPAERFDLARYLASDDAPGKAYSLAGGFLRDLAGFDHACFGLSHREASLMDPQQRLALETSWRALQDAGVDPAALASGDASQRIDAAVFFGIGQNEYGPLCRARADGEDVGLMATGQSMNIIAGRIARLFGFEGPAICFDTACSSSLVAVDAAVRHLRSGRNRCAVVGGVNALVSPETFVLLSKARALSRAGRCAAFDVRADGYVRAEGCVVMLLKRLADARSDGDAVHAVIRGSAVNHDGRSSGLTTPSGPAQERVMRAALHDARLEPGRVTVIEAHGTGTVLGDPIEYHALRAVYADHVARAAPLVLTTVKSLIGHTEAASGLAGLLKLVLSLRARMAPPQTHFARLNRFIEASPAIEIPRQARSLAAGEGQRGLIGAVSAFGFNGTNAHVIVERGDDRPSRRLPGQPFQRVRCWYTGRPLAQSSGLAQAFGGALAEPAPAHAGLCSYAVRWLPYSPAVRAAHQGRRRLLWVRAPADLDQANGQRQTERPDETDSQRDDAALRAAFAARGVEVVDAAWHADGTLTMHGDCPGSLARSVPLRRTDRFERILLRIGDAPRWPDNVHGTHGTHGALDTCWLDRLAGIWSALSRLGPELPPVLVLADPYRDDSARISWAGVLACLAKERAGPAVTWLERWPACDRVTLAAQADALLALDQPLVRLANDGFSTPHLTAVAPVPLVGAAPFRARDGHAYLVSGGLGGIGAQWIGWLLERGARHIVSLSRSAPDAAQTAALDRLAERHGARIDVLAVDVRDGEALRATVHRALSGVPLAGVFHAASVLDDCRSGEHGWSEVRAVLLAKGAGAWHLHRITLGEPLDHFVVCSSLAALLGQPGQAAYALANGLAEAVVAARRALGLPALAVQWGPWADTGMAARAGQALREQHRVVGLRARAARDYLQVLEGWLTSPVASQPADGTVGVFDLDWQCYATTYAPVAPWAALVGDARGVAGTIATGPDDEPSNGASAASATLAARLARLPPGARGPALRTELRAIVAACRARDDAATIADSDGFAQIGIDSLHATVLHRRLERELDVRLPSTVAFDYPCVAALADFLARGPLASVFPAACAAAAPALAGQDADALALMLRDELADADLRGARR